MRHQALMRLLHDIQLQKQLNVTPDQLKRLQDVVFNAEKSTIQDRATLQLRRLELQHLEQAETPDRTSIDKKLQEVVQAQGALERTRVNEMLDVRSVLTKEQQDKIRDLMQQRMRTRQAMMNRQGTTRWGMMRRANPPAPMRPGN